MIDFIFAMIAVAAAHSPSDQVSAAPSVIIGEGVQIGSNTVIGDPVTAAPDGLAFDLSVLPDGLMPEPQIPLGKFTTATEVKPILTATKANWVALRDYGGNDLVYVTHLWSWRCGLSAMALAINDGPMQNLDMPECHMEYATPNAVLEQDGLPYLTYPQGSVTRLTVQIVYDDLTTDIATFEADQIRIP
ncbi:hypothetical protein [uncultured Sulfitobacter sp.]|uniref:hypothetical protein n=1 Tax=uncultured Sulfitobacter sp. TaxID=191468 RepID=UPI00262E9A37|nr:hypothetical protein [uncultured Sulfitobacter sp.]